MAQGASTERVRDLTRGLEEAQAALAAGDYTQAYARYEAASREGNGLADFNLGLFHRMGWGRVPDAAGACKWFGRAATANLPAAQHFYGDCLRDGTDGVSQPAEAAQWYRRAIDQGYAAALCPLGELLFDGRGVVQSQPKGLALCRQAAESGDLAAQRHLAALLLRAAPPDHAAAIDWLTRAAQRDDPAAQLELGTLLAADKDASPETLNTAAWWLEHAASSGYLPAYLPLARLYFGEGRAADGSLPSAERLAKAYLWLSSLQRRGVAGPMADETARLMAEVLAIMPASWRPDLDRQVSQHVAQRSENATH